MVRTVQNFTKRIGILLTVLAVSSLGIATPTASAVGITATATAWANTWAALPTASGTPIASGTLTTNGKTPSVSGTVVLFAEPANFSAGEAGGTVAFTPLSRAVTSRAGKWTLTIPAGSDLTGSSDAAGNVNFEVRSFDGVGSGSYFFSAKEAPSLAAGRIINPQAVSAGITSVAGTTRTLTTSPGETTKIALTSSMAPNVAATGVAATADAAIAPNDTHYQCTNGSFRLYGNVRVRIARLYSDRPSSVEQLTYTQGSSTSLGVGFSGSGVAGSWGVSGTSTKSSTDTMIFPVMRGATARVAYTYFQYDKWVQTCRVSPSGAVISKVHFFGPSRWTGGQIWATGTRLGMGYCLSHAIGSTYIKDRSAAYEGSADVASSGIIQINLSARTGYTTDTSISFSFGHTRPLCGYRDYEGGSPQLLTIHGPI